MLKEQLIHIREELLVPATRGVTKTQTYRLLPKKTPTILPQVIEDSIMERP